MRDCKHSWAPYGNPNLEYCRKCGVVRRGGGVVYRPKESAREPTRSELFDEIERLKWMLNEGLRIPYEEGWPATENENPYPRNDPEHLEPPEYERAMTPDEFKTNLAALYEKEREG